MNTIIMKVTSFDLSSEVNFPLNDTFKSYLRHIHGRESRLCGLFVHTIRPLFVEC